jgi:hypothetical protein
VKLTPTKYQKVTRAHYGLRGRPPKSEVPSITKKDYGYVLARWSRFDEFKAWRDRGGPKPPNVWKIVPQWDGWTPWDLLHEIRAKWPLVKTHPIAPQPPSGPPPFSLAPAQCWLFIAQEYGDATAAPGYFGRAYVADRAYQRPSPADVAAYKAAGVRQRAWCDSREGGDGTTPQEAVNMANELGLNGIILQAERLDECRSSLAMFDRLGGNGHILIGNLSQMQTDAVLYADLSARIRRGNVLWIQEVYKNCGQGGPDWKGLPVAGSCGASYQDADCSWTDPETYYANGWVAAHRDSWYTPQLSRDMYARLR